MAWCPKCTADRVTQRRPFPTPRCPYCDGAKEAAHRKGCRGPAQGMLDVCMTCGADLFGSALSPSGFEFLRTIETQQKARRRVVNKVLIVLGVAATAAGSAAGVWYVNEQRAASQRPGVTAPPPPPPPAATQPPAAPTEPTPPPAPAESPVLAAVRAVFEDATERDAIGRMAVAAIRPAATLTAATVKAVRQEGEVVVLELDLTWSDRATKGRGTTQLRWRCGAQGHLEARAGDDKPPKLDNLFRTSVWPKVEAKRKR